MSRFDLFSSLDTNVYTKRNGEVATFEGCLGVCVHMYICMSFPSVQV